MSYDDDHDWMTAQAAAAVLNRSDRQIRTYAQQGRIKTRRRGPGGRVEYYRPDVEALAVEIGAAAEPPRASTVEIVPAVQLARRVDELTVQLVEAERRAATLAAALDGGLRPAEAREMQSELARAQAEAEGLRAQLAQATGSTSTAWRVALLALAVALLAVAAVVIIALAR